jgi:hypothetical protein
MATYRLLSDFYNNGAYSLAGDIITMPDNFVPSAAMDPLDTPGVNALHAAGPQTAGLIRQQWVGVPVNPPVTYWKKIPGGRMWQLSGLGANLPPIGF